MTIDFLQEIANHKSVGDINIVQCHGISQDPSTKNYLIVMDYIEGGDLRQYLILVAGLGTGIYFFTKSSENKNPDSPNTQYLPNEEEFQAKVDQLKSEKGIDDQQAQIE
ncbi:1207_t:CDS:2, partial [Ambispora leptoticha]